MSSGGVRKLFRRGFEGVLVEYWREIMTAAISFATLAGILSAWCLSHQDKRLAIVAGSLSALAAGLTAATGLLRAVEHRTYESKQARRRQALEMLREWNQQTASARSTLERALPGLYDQCQRLSREEAIHLYRGSAEARPALPSSQRPSPTYDRLDCASADTVSEVREHIVELLNYFEYVSSAYLKQAADRDILRESFAGTMVRYYCILGEFMAREKEQTGRNPWAPYTEFVESMLAERRSQQMNDQDPGIRDCLRPKDGKFICAADRACCVWRGQELCVPLSAPRVLVTQPDDAGS